MELYWEDDYAIALALKHAHPTVDPLDVDWATLHQWVVDLPEFADDQVCHCALLAGKYSTRMVRGGCFA